MNYKVSGKSIYEYDISTIIDFYSNLVGTGFIYIIECK